MPLERAAQVYDFALFLKTVSASATTLVDEDDDWLNDSPEQIAAEDAVWDAAYAQHREKIRLAAREAIEEYQFGKTDELFDEHGNVKP